LIWAQLVVAWSLAIFMMVSERILPVPVLCFEIFTGSLFCNFYRFFVLKFLPVLCFEIFTGSSF
jgi:hypothetical protein